MLAFSRFLTLRLNRPPLLQWTRKYSSKPNYNLPEPPHIESLETTEDSTQARAWLARFKQEQIPRSLVDLTFSRSSGPGGQNVNKVNTKVSLRCRIDADWIPPWARIFLRNSPYYASSSQSILLTSTTFRSQAQNIDDCLCKLHDLVSSAASAPIRNEPSAQQKRRVIALEKADKANRRKEKSYRSQVKKGRASGRRGGDWD